MDVQAPSRVPAYGDVMAPVGKAKRDNVESRARANRLTLPVHLRCMDIGAAGEHIVCADLLISGYRAFLASQGLPYDVVLDLGDRLLRVTVKTTIEPRVRPARTGSRPCYQFNVTRSATSPERRRAGGKKYDINDADIIALVALDIRRVAYVPIIGARLIYHIDSPAHPFNPNKFGPKYSQRKKFEHYPLADAIDAVCK